VSGEDCLERRRKLEILPGLLMERVKGIEPSS